VPPGNGTTEAVVDEVEVISVLKPPAISNRAATGEAAAPPR
jgi:hypothetical protein